MAKSSTLVGELGSSAIAVTSSVWPLSSARRAEVKALYILTVAAHAANMCWPSGLARAPMAVIVPPPDKAITLDLFNAA